MHREKLHPTTDLSMVGCIICSTCREAVPGSPQAMSQHQCGAFVTKAQKVASALRDAVLINHHTSSQNKSSDDPSTNATTSKKSFWGKPSVDVKQYSDLISEEAIKWVHDTPTTHRIVRKREWDNLRSMFLGAIHGYSNAIDKEQREQQELLVLNLVRLHLRTKQTGEHNSGQPQGQESSDPRERHLARLSKKVTMQLQLGAVGKAARTLAAPPMSIATPSPALVEKLKALFPTEEPSNAGRQGYTMLRLDSSLVKEVVIKRMSRAAAPGPDGWTRELLIPLVKDKNCLRELTELLRRMLSDDCSLQFKSRVLGSLLCPLAKPDGGIRPICPESALVKLASIIAIRLLPASDIAEAVTASQYGVGGNVVNAVQKCRTLLQRLPFAAALDAKNAFNCISRKMVLEKTFQDDGLAPLRGIVEFSLGASTPICLRSGEWFPCSSGVRQGSVLGPILFATTIKPVIEDVEATGCSVVAYLDDVTIFAASEDQLQQGISAAEKAFKNLLLELNGKKCVSLHHDNTPIRVQVAGTCVVQNFGPTRILGALCGPGEYSTILLKTIRAKYEHLFVNLMDVPLQTSKKMMILRSSSTCAMTFIAQTHDETDTADATKFFDDCVEHSAGCILNLSEEESLLQKTKTLMRLPLKMGGLGLTSAVSVAKAATAAKTTATTHADALAAIHEASNADLLSSLSGPEAALQESSTNGWLADAQANMSDDASKVAARLRLLLRVRQGLCRCPRKAEATTDHLLTCNSLSKIERHNAVVNTLARHFREVNLSVTVEPFSLATESRARPDILVVASTPFGAGTLSFATDVVVCHATTNKTLLSKKNAAVVAAEGKMQRWGEWARNGNISFSPGVVTTTGTVAKNFRKWIFDVLSCSSLVGDEVAEKAHDISIALGVATMEATKKMFSFVC